MSNTVSNPSAASDVTTPHYTATIVGGGMVGLTMAIALAKNHKLQEKSHQHQNENHTSNTSVGTLVNIAIIDIHDLESQIPKATTDGKCTAIAKGTLDIFKQLGIAELIPQLADNAIEQIHVSVKQRFGMSQLNAKEYFDDTENNTNHASRFGNVVHNCDINRALLQTISTLNANGCNISLISPANITNCTKNSNGWSLEFSNHDSLKTKCLIISDGARSQLRQALGLPIQHHDYAFNAIACLVDTEKSHQNIAYERFLMPGTLAMLPTGKQQFGCVWTMPREQAQELIILDKSEQEAQLQDVFGWRCGKLSITKPLLQFPLHRVIAPTQAIPNTFVLGNAAHNLHPVAGQGFNLSMRDVYVLSQLLIAHHFDCNTVTTLYNASRDNDQTLTNYFSHILPKLFDNTLPFSDLARQSGLVIFDGLPVAAKMPFVNQAMGKVSFVSPNHNAAKEQNV